MEILNIIVNDDGSATMDCEFSKEEVGVLINRAVVDILRKQVELHNQEANLDE